MTTYISILRGINVSGHRMVKMEDLKQALTDAGLKNIRTYIQSGNVVFQYKKTGVQQLENMIMKLLYDHFKFEIPVIVLELAMLKSIADNNPFIKDAANDAAFMHVTFLSAQPGHENVTALNKYEDKTDSFIIQETAVYLYCPNGYGNTKLSNNFFENKLKVTATTRNWKTILKLIEMGEGMCKVATPYITLHSVFLLFYFLLFTFLFTTHYLCR